MSIAGSSFHYCQYLKRILVDPCFASQQLPVDCIILLHQSVSGILTVRMYNYIVTTTERFTAIDNTMVFTFLHDHFCHDHCSKLGLFGDWVRTSNRPGSSGSKSRGASLFPLRAPPTAEAAAARNGGHLSLRLHTGHTTWRGVLCAPLSYVCAASDGPRYAQHDT